MFDVFWFPAKDYPLPSLQPRSTLTKVKKKEIEKAHKYYAQKKKKVNWFSGALSDDWTDPLVGESDGTGLEHVVADLTGSACKSRPSGMAHTETAGNSVQIRTDAINDWRGWKQKAGACCALNSLANAAIMLGVPLAEPVYSKLCKDYGGLDTLKGVASVISEMERRPVCATAVPVERPLLAQHLLSLRDGVFAVESAGHCTTIDCRRRIVVDSDPRHPRPLDLDAWHQRLGITTDEVSAAYSVTPAFKSKPRRKKLVP